MKKAYTEHKGKVIEANGKYKHVMAIALDPRSGYHEGVVRCITSREGDVALKGFIDRSILAKVSGNSLENFEIGEELKISNQKEIVEKYRGDRDFIGLEDPDIWIDEKTGLLHLYFTMPTIRGKKEDKTLIYLGHAVGKNLDTLVMTDPSLVTEPDSSGAKELSIAPANKNGIRLNLVESSRLLDDTWISTVRIAIAEDMGKPWKFGPIVFDPPTQGAKWIAGHASPGPLLPPSFLDVGPGKRLGIINGREANRKVGNKTKYGTFAVGLMIYDYEKGKIDWVSSEPLIIDSAARTITFASQFVETAAGEGILYAHVDDSFVRAYTLYTEGIKPLLPK